MKKFLSVLLSVLIIASVLTAGMSAFAAGDELKIAVASDLHYNVPREVLEGPQDNMLPASQYNNSPIDDEIYWYANRRAAMEDEGGFIIDEFLDQCAADESIEYVLISGDLADNGRTQIQEHYDVAAKLRAFEEASGKDVFVINGNHDFGNGENDTKVNDFVSIYADFGYDKALETVEGTCSYTADLGAKYRLIALDSCDYSVSTEDGMTSEKLGWVEKQAEKAKADGRYPILMMHHNLLDHMPLQRILSHDFIIRNHTLTADKFADWGIKVVFTGHEHCSDASVHISPKGNKVYDFATTSLTMYPLQYRVVDFKDDVISYEEKTVDSIDTEALASIVDGYSDKQLALMNEGLNEYSKGFLKKGIEYRLALSLSMGKIGISEGEAFYDLVYTAVSGLTDLLEMPLYGENGVQELAKEYNIDIPNSEYTTGWDLATELVSWHYAGEEAFELDSTEVTILLRMVDLILLDDLSGVNDEVFLKAANSVLGFIGIDSVCGDLTKLGTKVFGPVTAGEYFLIAVASPLLYEFAYDSDGVNDNHGTIEGYGAGDSSVNVMDKITNFFEKLVTYLKSFLNYFLKIFRIF